MEIRPFQDNVPHWLYSHDGGCARLYLSPGAGRRGRKVYSVIRSRKGRSLILLWKSSSSRIISRTGCVVRGEGLCKVVSQVPGAGTRGRKACSVIRSPKGRSLILLGKSNHSRRISRNGCVVTLVVSLRAKENSPGQPRGQVRHRDGPFTDRVTVLARPLWGISRRTVDGVFVPFVPSSSR
jgi:hypothetical protein